VGAKMKMRGVYEISNLDLFYCVFFLPNSASSADILKIFTPENEDDPRFYSYNYVQGLCFVVMDATKDMGGYKIVWLKIPPNTSQSRVTREVVYGNMVNAEIAVVGSEWEETTIPIHIPVMKGILGVRLLLVTNDNLQKFAQISEVDELKKMKMGLSKSSWVFEQEFKSKGFRIVVANYYAGSFKMLCKDRFDYLPRGIIEIYSEYKKYKKKIPCIEIEPTLALRINLPVYFYVSPQYPGLARRIQIGLERIM
jgi:hypothetical protein